MRILSHQDLLDLVDGAAIFSAAGGGDPNVGFEIVDKLVEDKYVVELVDPLEVPDEEVVVNFACVGATTTVTYDSDAAVRTFQTLERFLGKRAYAAIPVELGGFNTLAAVDVAARLGIPVVDADGAGRAVPEVHLKVYTIDRISLAPMVVSDCHAQNVVIVKETLDSQCAERIARTLAAEWEHSAYTARRVLTGKQVKTSPILRSLSQSIKIGTLLRKEAYPIRTIIEETKGVKLFHGIVDKVERETKAGFTYTKILLKGTHENKGSRFEFKAKNEILVAYKDRKLAAIAPDIITPVNPKTGTCVTAEKIEKADRLVVLGIPAPQKWRTNEGLQLWKDVLQRSHIRELFLTIEQLSE